MSIYLHPELSALSFQERVLALTQIQQFPLLEQLRFIGITQSNIEDLFCNRIARQREKKLGGFRYNNQVKKDLYEKAQKIYELKSTLFDELVNKFKQHQIHFVLDAEDSALEILQPRLKKIIKSLKTSVFLAQSNDVFSYQVSRVVTHQFILSKPINVDDMLCFSTDIDYFYQFNHDDNLYVLALPIIVPLLIESIYGEARSAYEIRLTRNRQIPRPKKNTELVIQKLKAMIEMRHQQAIIKLAVNCACPPSKIEALRGLLSLDSTDVYPINLGFCSEHLIKLYHMLDLPELKFNEHRPHFELIGDKYPKEALLLYPFDSIQYLLNIVSKASMDSNVKEITITLYRLDQHGLLFNTLCLASANGKKVNVYVELYAREDEENNIRVFDALKMAGINVVYNVSLPVVHAKFFLIHYVTKGQDRYLAHIGTGNYHLQHAQSYTDINLLTQNKTITKDVQALAKYILGEHKKLPQLKSLVSGVDNLAYKLHELIDREITHAKEKKPAFIITKVNTLSDKKLVNKLYEASQAGVLVILVIRDVCSIKPAIPKISEHVYVFSVAGRWLEHGRIHLFCNAGHHDTYISSSNWTNKKLHKRIEILVPIENKSFKRRLLTHSILCQSSVLATTWMLEKSGEYQLLEQPLQMHVCDLLKKYEYDDSFLV